MAIIGNPIISTDFPKDTFSGTGSTTAFTMAIAPASVNAVIVVVSGITQDPSTYTISGTTLTFSAAPPTGTSNISVRHLGVAGIPNTPSAGSVTSSSLASGAITSAALPTGSVLQVVQGTYSTSAQINSGSYVDTGLTASITPKFATSKILAIASLNYNISNGNNVPTTTYINLVRNSTQLTFTSNTLGTAVSSDTNNYAFANTPITYLDSPATTSATTYKVQAKSVGYLNMQINSGTSTLTLIEVAA